MLGSQGRRGAQKMAMFAKTSRNCVCGSIQEEARDLAGDGDQMPGLE